MNSTIQAVANCWIAFTMSKEGSDTYEEFFLCYETLDGWCSSDPNKSIQTIDAIARLNSSDKILSNLAAGLLETVLVRQGHVVIDDVITLAVQDAVWKKMLGAVWKNDIADDIWLRIRSVAGPSW